MAYPSTLQLEEGIIYMDEVGKMFPVGQKGETPDGRIFRHSLVGAGMISGALCQNRAKDTSWDTCDITTGYSTAVDDNSIRLTNQSDTWAKNELENGFLACETDDAALGPTCWRIGGNGYSTGTGPLIIYLADGLTFGAVLVAGTDKMMYMPSLYSKIIIMPATTHTGIPIGVTMVKLTTAYYGWIQTHGVCAVLADNNGSDWTIGETLVADTSTAGSVENETQHPELFRIAATITAEGVTNADTILVYLHIE